MEIRRFYIFLILLLLSLAAMLQVSQHDSHAACAPAPAGLVSWWKGEGTDIDQTLKNNFFINNSTTYTAGKSGQAFSFNGTNSVLIGSASGLPAGNADRTLAMWVYINQFVPGEESYFVGYGDNMAGEFYYLGASDNGTLCVSVSNQDGYSDSCDGPNVPSNGWHHVAVTQKGISAIFYLDGVPRGASGFVSATTPAGDFRAGYLDPIRKLNGYLDEIQVFNRALSEAEILAIYNADNFGVCTDLTPPTAGTSPQVAAGSSHSVMIKPDGTLWSWGSNDVGQLGDGTVSTTPRPTPMRIGTATNWASVAAGSDFTVAIKSDGTIWSWGNNASFYNGSNALGYPSGEVNPVPRKIDDSTNWASVSASYDYAMAIKTDGTLWAWGDNTAGKLGDGATTNSPTPKKIGFDTDWANVTAGGQHTLALKRDGSLWAWGSNGSGTLGDGTTVPRLIPTRIGSDSSWVSIVAGPDYSFGIKSDGSLWAWGGHSCNFPVQSCPTAYAPVLQSAAPDTWIQLMKGGISGHVVALKSDGTLWAWGNNTQGQISSTPTGGSYWSLYQVVDKVSNMPATNWLAVATGESHTIAVKLNGSVFSWGNNSSGQLGRFTRTTTDQAAPNLVTPLKLAGGYGFSLAVAPDGTLWGVGNNGSGQLGLGDTVNRTELTQIGNDSDWATVSTGNAFSLALKADGSLWQWGYQIGSSGTYVYTPVRVGADTDWVEIAAGYTHALALKSSGSLWSWGNNSQGQLGNGVRFTAALAPIPINAGETWTTIAAGDSFSGAIKSDGTIWAWGDTSNSQVSLGNTFGQKLSPTFVTGTPNNGSWQSLAAGYSHFLATKNRNSCNNYIVAWGGDYLGQAGGFGGDPATGNGYVDWVADIGAIGTCGGKAIVKAGGDHSMALNQDGELWTWGDNNWGQSGSYCDYNWNNNCISSTSLINGTWTSIAAGAEHSLGQKADGTFWGWGRGTGYGYNNNYTSSTPRQIGGSPYLNSISISSNNSKTEYAKVADTVAVSFTSSAVISAPSVTIAGQTVRATRTDAYGMSWTAQHTMKASDTEGTVAFSIRYMDPLSGKSYTSQSTTTNGSMVVFDKTPPSISGANSGSANGTYTSGNPVNVFLNFSEPVSSTDGLTINLNSGASLTTGALNNVNSWSGIYTVAANQNNADLSVSSVTGTIVDGVGNSTSSISVPSGSNINNSRDIIIDTTKPTVTITSPVANFMDTVAPTNISGTASDNFSVTKVEVQVTATPSSDSIFKCIFMDGQNLAYGDCPSNPAPWISIPSQKGTLGNAVNGTSSWSLNVNSAGLTSNAVYTINARSTDGAGQVSNVATSNFSRVATRFGTRLYAMPLSTVLLSNTGSTTVQGQLTLQDSTITGVSLISQPITVTVKDANGAPVAGSPFTGSTTDSAGHFSINGIGNIALPGTYKLQAHFSSAITAGAGLTSSDSPEYTITVGNQPGYAVIVQGRITTGEGVQAHARTANRIYKTLKDRGFQASNIKYLGPSATNPDSSTAGGVTLESTPASPQSIQAAIAWAKGQISSSPAPFYLIMVDHGVNGVFRIDSGNTVVNITPQALNSWLAVMDEDLVVKGQKQVIMIGSCYSGSFIDSLKQRPGRVIITSAAANEESYKGSLEQPDGVRSGEYFLDALFHELKIGYSLTSAFRIAAGKTRDFTRQGWSLSANSLYGDNSVQHPLLDDTGDGVGVNQVSDQSGDGALAATMYLGIGDTKTNAVDPGEIVSVTPTDTIAFDKNSYTLWLKSIVGLPGLDNAVSAWAEVRRPDLIIPSQKNQVSEQISLVLDTVPLTISGDFASGSFSSFTTSGKYEVFYYTRKLSGAISEVRRSVIYKKDFNGTAPKSFNLIAPAYDNKAQKSNGIIFNWNPTTDGDINQQLWTPITYTLVVCDNPSFSESNGAYCKRLEELTDTFAKLDKSDGILDGKTYFWKVIATDLYGNTTENSKFNTTDDWKFTVNDNTNAPTLYFYKGTVLDADTKAPLSGATVTSSAASWTTITNGRYLVYSDLSEPSPITASYPGYKDATISVEPIFSTSGTNYVDNTFYLVSNTPLLTLNFGGNGEGSVNGEISCMKGGSCPPVQLVADSPVTLTPAPVTTSSVFSGWSGACTNPTGICTITMNGAKTVTAAFSLAPKIKLDLNATSGYDIFADAYSNSTANLYSMNSTLVSDWTLSAGKAITLIGGYQADYQARTGYTVLNGKLSVQSGKLQVDGLKVR